MDWSTLGEIRDLELERGNEFPDISRLDPSWQAKWVAKSKLTAYGYVLPAGEWERVTSGKLTADEKQRMKETVFEISIRDGDIFLTQDGDGGYLVVRPLRSTNPIPHTPDHLLFEGGELLTVTLIDALPHDEIIYKFEQMERTYEDLAIEYHTSRGTIWRILKRHDMLRHRVKQALRTKRDREALRLDLLDELMNHLEEMDVLEYLEMIPTDKVKLCVTSPPYNIGKEYEVQTSFVRYKGWMMEVLSEIYRVLDKDGTLFLNLGNFVKNGAVKPLDWFLGPVLEELGFKIWNRNIWHFRHGLHAKRKFSHRHETVIFATKGDNYSFNLDNIRIPQLCPNKRYYKGPRRGQVSSHPGGKNPGDVWDIPNVKHNHPEKFVSSIGETHPCQFPEDIPRIAILACTKEGDIVLDPFTGSGTVAKVAKELGRVYLGCDISYVPLARERVGLAKTRQTSLP